VLDADETADLLYMREEEKLAHDEYLTLYDVHGLKIHKQIAKAEQKHTDAVAGQLSYYGLEDPVVDDSVGAFVNLTLDGLYDALVAWGTTSPVDALRVGATIEDLDMVDLARAISHTDEESINDVYSSLLCGSRNHLRAFVGVLDTYGETYEATYMDPDDMAEILATEHERCG